VDDLLRMDSPTMMDTISKGIGAGVMKPNEGRARLNLGPVQGGDTPYLQVQNYSLAALDKRDTAEPPPPSPTAESVVPPEPPDDDMEEAPSPEDVAKAFDTASCQGLVLRHYHEARA